MITRTNDGIIRFEETGVEAYPLYILPASDQIMVLEWRNHLNVRKWMYNNQPIGLEEHLAYIKGLASDNKNSSWLIKSDGKYVGIASLHRLDVYHRHGFLGIYGCPDSVVNGRGDILMYVIKKIAKDVLGLHTLKLEVFEDNEHAINYYEKHGFVREGVLREFVRVGGEYKDVFIYGCLV